MMSPEAGAPGPKAGSPAAPEVLNPFAKWPDSYFIAILILLAVLPYVNSLWNGFVYDDNAQVLNNPYVQNFSHLGDIFSTTVWSYVGAQGVTNYYRPMMTFSYLLLYQAFGPMAYPYHLASVLLHAGIVCLLFVLTVRMTASRLVGLFSAGMFALHPIHTESVAWIAAVTDLQLTLFFLLAFWSYVQVAAPGGARRPAMQAAMTVSFVLAIISKEQSLMLPVLATAYEHFFREDRGETTFGQKMGRYYLLWLVTAAYLVFRVRFFGAIAPVLQISNLTWSQTILSAIALVGQYMGKLLWPAELCAFYVFRRSTSLFEPRVLAGLLALLALAVLFAILWRRARKAAFAVIWMLVTLAPVLNPRWLAANVFTERYLYLPSVGFCWLAAWGWVSLWEVAQLRPLRRKVLVGALVVIGTAYAARIVTRSHDWSDDVTLYTQTLALSPDSYHIRNNLGTVLWKQGRVSEAEREWETALALHPKNAIVLNNLGLVKSQQKRYEEAIDYFQRATRIKPIYMDPHLNLGAACLELGRPDAEIHLRAAVALSPLNVEARDKLGKVFFDSGRLVEAGEQFTKSAESQPNWAAFEGLGEIDVRHGDMARAERNFRRAIDINPLASNSHFALAEIYANSGRQADAKLAYRTGLSVDPANAEAQASLNKLEGKGRNDNTGSH
jgi:Tfp pilus assembly protein PilF